VPQQDAVEQTDVQASDGAGRVTDFVRHVAVHWNDCDPASIVFHAHYERWMDEGFHGMARARGVDLAALQVANPGFVGSPLVNISCAFRSPAKYSDTLEHRISPPEIGAGRSYRVNHSFQKAGATVAEGEQVRIWAMAGPDGEGLRAVSIPPDIAIRLHGKS
jgi:YbgC/YbaW family acyl-CoA thioester hydrolase